MFTEGVTISDLFPYRVCRTYCLCDTAGSLKNTGSSSRSHAWLTQTPTEKIYKVIPPSFVFTRPGFTARPRFTLVFI